MLFCPPEEKICTFPSNVLQWRKTSEVFSVEELILYVKYQAKPGCRETFVRQIVEKGILTAIRQEPGCLAYDYYFSAQDENELLLIERWQSAEHQRVHMQQPHMQQLRAIKEQYVDSTTLGKVRLEA